MSDRTCLVQLLHADEAHREAPPGLATFGQFIGRWEMTVQFFNEDGQREFDGLGTWVFGWIMDGRAIQDVLHYWPKQDSEPEADRQFGTSLRFYDPRHDEWTITWLGAVSGICLRLVGGPRPDGQIVLGGPDVDGSQLRWSFTDITDVSFTWVGETRRSEDHDWRIEQFMTATRRS